MTHAGSVLVKTGMFYGRLRRRLTTAPVASSPTRLQLFLPRSIPRTATLTAMSLFLPMLIAAYAAGAEGRAIP